MNDNCGRRSASQRAVAAKSCARRATSPRLLPGKQGHDLRARIDPERAARGLPVDRHRNRIGERMADEFGVHAVLVVEALLEGQQAQHQIHGLVNAARPPLPPRPDLGTHVLHGRDAGRVQPAREAQVGIRGVDADENIGTSGQKSSADARQQ